MTTRTVTWGDALLVKSVKHRGGLNQAVINIRGAVGPEIGVRNSFAKLYNVEDPTDLNERDLWRCWLLLTAIGENPDNWGIGNEVIPGIHQTRVATLRRLLGAKGKPSDYSATVSRPSNRKDGTAPKSR